MAVPMVVGTSGWQYRDWRGPVLPASGSPWRRWLENYATRFPTVENNGTFYRLPAPATFADWRVRTPAGLRDGGQGEPVPDPRASDCASLRSRSRDCSRAAVASVTGWDRCLSSCRRRCERTRPPWTSAWRQFSAQFAAARPAGRCSRLRVCVEFRHPSWETQEVQQILARHNAALCWSDRRGRPRGPLWRTADWGYLRLHEGAAQPWPHYGRQALRTWLTRISDNFPPEADVFAYFNNDQHAAAPSDAESLVRLADRSGWPVQPPAQPERTSPGPHPSPAE